MIFINLIEGNSFEDVRGNLKFFNSFNMAEINRMYEISPSNTVNIRGWQAHKLEKKWFYCNAGAFIINLIAVDNFESPSKNLKTKRILLEAKKPSVLEISGGYATAFKAEKENSKLLVFSNFSLEASKADDFRYKVDHWSAIW